MTFSDWLRIIHPILAVVLVYPLLGVVMYFAWKTRQRRLEVKAGVKSKISPQAGLEHVAIGRWLTGTAAGVALLGLLHPIVKTIVKKQVWQTAPGQVIFIILMFAATIGSLLFLFRTHSPTWRATFATLTTGGLIIIGSQDGIFRRENEWLFSHYYYGITVTILMIVSLAILPEIYRNINWRRVHIVLNSIALLLFLIQGITGVRDLLEIPVGS
jgi:Protein of unknown function (DUF4079)